MMMKPFLSLPRLLQAAALALAVGMAPVAMAQQFANVATVSATNALTTGHVCYTDGRDIACSGRNLYMDSTGRIGQTMSNPSDRFETVGVTLATAATSTRVSGSTLQYGSLVLGGVTINSVPSGAVVPFNLGSCPTGWTAFAGAVARSVVGSGSSYSLNATGGATTTAMTTATMPAHSHTIDINSIPDSSTESGHTHTGDFANPLTSDNQGTHTHTFDPGPAGTSGSPAHQHVWVNGNGYSVTMRSGGTPAAAGGYMWVSLANAVKEGQRFTGADYNFATAEATTATHAHWGDPDPAWSSSAGGGSHVIDFGGVATGYVSADHTHAVAINKASTNGPGSGSAMTVVNPYVALLYCKKN